MAEGVHIVPILVDETEMPDPKGLPDDLVVLTERNARRISDRNFDADLSRLLDELPAPPPPPEGRLERIVDRFGGRGPAAVTAIGLVASLLAIYQFVGPNDGVVAEQDPFVPMGGGFNIAVAGLEAIDGSETDESNALALSAALVTALDDLDDERYLIWGPDEIGVVSSDEVVDTASEINAHLLVHGTIEEDRFGDYHTSIEVHTRRQNDRAPWPLDLDRVASFDIPPAKVADGSVSQDPRLEALALALDGLAALLGDSLSTARDRLVIAEQAIQTELAEPSSSDDDGAELDALVTALQAYILLVEATYELDDQAVDDALGLADEAVGLDPDLELAHLALFSAQYLDITPIGPPITVACKPSGEAPPPPDPLTSPTYANGLWGTRAMPAQPGRSSSRACWPASRSPTGCRAMRLALNQLKTRSTRSFERPWATHP